MIFVWLLKSDVRPDLCDLISFDGGDHEKTCTLPVTHHLPFVLAFTESWICFRRSLPDCWKSLFEICPWHRNSIHKGLLWPGKSSIRIGILPASIDSDTL